MVATQNKKMLKKISKDDMFVSKLGWLESRFHFSFADYYNPKNINFGVLRVLNDDIIHPQSGFGTHPHKDMEIISYIVNGEITHKDSMGNERTLKRGEVQYMSAGTGIFHSEYNHHKSKDLRLLQMWILPPKNNLEPIYGEELYKEVERKNKLLKIVSNQQGNARVKIHQDVDIYVSELEKDQSIHYQIAKNKQIYFVLIEGKIIVNNIELTQSDALQIVEEDILNIKPLNNSYFLFIEMVKD